MKFSNLRMAPAALSALLSLPLAAQAQDTPLAEGHDKYLGSIFATSQLDGFTDYFNFVVAENAGKWGVVTNQSSRPTVYEDEWFSDSSQWHGGLDNSFDLARDNGFEYRMHVLVWGNQQPQWMAELEPGEQLDAVHEWYDVLAARYNDDRGGFDYIEAVNEPVNDPPDQPDDNGQGGDYMDALGGEGETGWDWAIKAFEMARDDFPGAKLMVNEYNVLSVDSVRSDYIELIELLDEDDLIDAVGIQAHAFSTQGSAAQIKSALDEVAATGLPIHITEMDVDGPTDREQLDSYRRIFPVFWEHEAVEGVTLWGFRPGLWRESAHLVEEDGTERLALKWLRCYLQCDSVTVIEDQVFEQGDSSTGGTVIGEVVAHSPNGDITGWEVVGGDQPSMFTIDAQGQLALAANAELDFNATSHHDLEVTAQDMDGSSESTLVRVNVLDEGGVPGGSDDDDSGDDGTDNDTGDDATDEDDSDNDAGDDVDQTPTATPGSGGGGASSVGLVLLMLLTLMGRGPGRRSER